MIGSTQSTDLGTPKRIHLVGAGGSGMSALAILCLEMGHDVSGSDVSNGENLRAIARMGVRTWVGHRPDAIADSEIVAASTAVPPDDPELVAAGSSGRTVLRRAELLAAMTRMRRTIAIAGTHGKTTTTAMCAHVLDSCGLEPSYLIGATPLGGVPAAKWAAGEPFVVEADESDSTFTAIDRSIGVVTNIEPDHLAHHGSVESLHEAFREFGRGCADLVIVCSDDPTAVDIVVGDSAIEDGVIGDSAIGDGVGDDSVGADPVSVRRYGFGSHSDVRATGLGSKDGGVTFEVVERGVSVAATMAMPGRHNVANALAAVSVARALGVELDRAVAALASFRGVSRRFERIGRAEGVDFIDDYAHLDGEIRATLESVAALGYKRVVCAFQPHRFTRTRDLAASFGLSFTSADELFLTGIYPSGEKPIDGVDGRLVERAVRHANPAQPLHYHESLDELADAVAEALRPGDVFVTLGAGDISTLGRELIHRLTAAS